MHIRNDCWQKDNRHWQHQLIHHNILTLGYGAWNGYLQRGRGLLVCDVVDPILPSIDWQVDFVSFNQMFIPQVQVAGYLGELQLEQTVVAGVESAIATYNPAQAIVLLIHGNQELEINLLQNLAISPVDCAKQVRRRWEEFQPQANDLRVKF
ncbi:MAG: hypothetical protein KME10_22285 [Plectolyngbya sp. WJT66-NPBG17]|jgi:hypothetical protein|nr:hypothetical protein [Plectolyngbya sp. WJT66-NPBG17]